MKFPSLQSLADGAARAFLRFPVAILLAVTASIFGMRWSHLTDEAGHRYGGVLHEVPHWYWNAIQACYLGMLLSIAVTVWVEKRRQGKVVGGRKWDGAGVPDARGARGGKRPGLGLWLQLGVVVFAGLYFWSLPDEFSEHYTLQTAVLALGLHWLIAVIGFGQGEVNGFWSFNKQLFLRALTAWLYTVVLYIGISLALLAVDKLFNVDIRYTIYLDCWWVLAGIFSVVFFLAGFPKSYANPPAIDDYPKGLKIFTQYILLSLVTVYLVILDAYMLKIIFTAHWPAGWVGWMVMAFSVLGILSLLLIYPLRNEEDNGWIRSFSRFYYFALLPLIGLLLCAIYKRVQPYGVTEQRYYLMALAGWLLFIAIYFLVSRVKDIRLVPLSLCILAFLSCWGPWGAFSVSLHSQERRLVALLEKDGRMVGGKVVSGGDASNGQAKLTMKDRVSISSMTEYIVSEHGYKKLQPYFRQNLDSTMRAKGLMGQEIRYGQAEVILGLMNVAYASRWSANQDDDSVAIANGPVTRYFQCHTENGSAVTTTDGASYAGSFELFLTNPDSCTELTVDKQRLHICPDNGRHVIHLHWDSGEDVGMVDLTPVVKAVLGAEEGASVLLTADQYLLPITGGVLTGKVVLTEVRGTKTGNVVEFNRISGIVLFSKR